jgi:ADP-ribose pyrophosphatase
MFERPRIESSDESRLSPWVTLVENRVAVPGQAAQTYHSFRQNDYVAILAVTSDERIPLVEQFRPALRRESLELPGGLLEAGESPRSCAARELAEEVGFQASEASLVHLGTWDADSGRLQNSIHAFFVNAVDPVADGRWKPEPHVNRQLVSFQWLRDALRGGSFRHALHVAVLGMAIAGGHLKLE